MGTKDKEKARKQYQDWYARNKESKKRYDRLWGIYTRYGMTEDDYIQMLLQQKGLCAICGQPEIAIDKRTGLARQLSVDHCHTTGKVRGLLCNHCNHGIGKFKDSQVLLQKAIDYLNRD